MNHYQPMQKAHTHHATTGNYSRYQTGKLVGEYRDIPAVIIDEAGFDGLGVQTQVGGADDAWCLVNVFDHLHRYVESVAINGAIDADHAVCVALGQFDHLETAYGKIVSAQDASFDQMHWSSTAIYRVLSDDRQNAHYLPIINHKQLYDAATRITGLSVQWDGINPVSHGNIGQLLLDMQKHDTYHEMVQTFDLAQALSDAQPMELDAFDALVESYNRLDLFKERLFRAMAKTPQDDIRVVNVTLTKPFKRQGVANIAMVFELSDGQHISIWFHNPDANPNKLGATDIMASWKWLLNRRDVTAALSPPNGANVQLPMLAHRMMRLAAKNSKRFIAAQKRKQVNQAKLAAAQSLVDERLAKLSEQDEEIERLSQQLASLTPTQAPQTIAKEVMVDVDAEVVGAASDDPDERLHAKPEQAVIHNPQQMAQKTVQDETDEPVVNISSLTTPVQELDKDAYFDEYKEIIKNNKMVYCPPLKDEVELRSKAGKHILNRGDYTVKFPLLKHVPQMIKTAFDKKPMTVVGKRNIKEAYRVFTNVQIDGENKIAGMVVFKDNNNRFIYDMYINEKNRIGKGVTLPSGVASSDDDADNPAPVTPLGNDNTQIDSLSQEFFEDDDAMLDSLKSGYVLNLFIFDEHGNEITDDIADNNSATKKITKGRKNSVKTAKGTKVDTVFALVDSKYVISSHTESGNENPKYDQSLQPRDRGRENSIAWVIKTANNLDPESLGRTGRADTGAPIVGDDMMVESGNGRTMAIKLAYKNGKADDYVAWLKENADLFGFTEAQVEKYKQPILVRIRTSEIDRATFAIEANQDDKLSLSATERARADAKRLSDGMMENFNPSDDGDILAASNRKFIQDFLAMLGDAEASQYTDSNGNPTQALMARIKACVFAKAYDDDRLLEMMADVTNPELQNMLNALSKTAPQFIKARVTAQRDTQELSEKLVDGIELAIDQRLKNALVDATNLILAAKRSNQALAQYVKQQNLFGDIDPDVIELALFIAQNARSAKKMAEYFGVMAKYITQDNIKRQNLDMFGEPELLNLKEVMAYANNELGLSSQPTQNELTSEMQENKMNKSMNPNYTQDDIDYLNSIVNGSTNPLEVDFDRLIAIGEKDDTDPLFEQANDVISQALDQATQGE